MSGSIKYTLLELVRVALGNQQSLSSAPNIQQWSDLLVAAEEQGITGVLMPALEKLYSQGLQYPKEISLEWIFRAEQIRNRNILLNKRATQLVNYFNYEGFRNCILKGQGNARMYPDPYSRSSGDIDIWLEGDKEEIRSFVRNKYPDAEECAWHIDFPIFSDVPVEVHYIPSYLRAPRFDKCLQQYYKDHSVEQFAHVVTLPGEESKVCIPMPEFNLIQQLSHVMRHFFVEGVGLRQILDIYYLLYTNKDEIDKQRIERNLKDFGMYDFASAVMWILGDALQLPEDFLIIKPNKQRGRLVLNEILQGGTWGRYDRRISKKVGGKMSLLPFILRNMRFVVLFPNEAIAVPLQRRINRITDKSTM